MVESLKSVDQNEISGENFCSAADPWYNQIIMPAFPVFFRARAMKEKTKGEAQWKGMLQRMEKTVAYIGSYSSSSGEGIYSCVLDRPSGKLIQAHAPVKAENPSYLAMNEDETRLYSVMETDTFHGNKGGGVSAFSVDASGGLSPLGSQPTLGENPCYLSTDGRYLLCANYTGGSMTVFPLEKDGSILPQSSLTVHSGSGPIPERQSEPHVHCADFAPGGNLIFAVDLGLDAVKFYRLNRSDGTVSKAVAEMKLRPGSGPRHAVFMEGLKTACVINEIASDIAVFRYDDGFRFEPAQYISTLPIGFRGENTAAAVRLSPDGRFLYASNRGHDSIAAFRVCEDGLLEAVGFFPSGGRGPRDIAIDPQGEFLLAANEKSGNVAVFRLDRETGVPEPAGEGVSLHSPVCIRFHTV